MIIAPTPGRVVWYRPTKEEDALAFREEKPLAAIVAYVWNDRLVNLMVIDGGGCTFERKSVQLVQDGDAYPPSRGYCEWMPYQKGQAAKTEALEKDLHRLADDGCPHHGPA
jgi:hypothetical protein